MEQEGEGGKRKNLRAEDSDIQKQKSRMLLLQTGYTIFRRGILDRREGGKKTMPDDYLDTERREEEKKTKGKERDRRKIKLTFRASEDLRKMKILERVPRN